MFVMGVEVEEFECGIREGEVGGGSNAKPRFDHSSHHAVDVVCLADVGDFSSALEAAGFAEFDVDELTSFIFG